MATNASCAIAIEDQADQVGSANGLHMQRNAEEEESVSDYRFHYNAIGFFMPKRKASGEPQTPIPLRGSLQRSPIPPSWAGGGQCTLPGAAPLSTLPHRQLPFCPPTPHLSQILDPPLHLRRYRTITPTELAFGPVS